MTHPHEPDPDQTQPDEPQPKEPMAPAAPAAPPWWPDSGGAAAPTEQWHHPEPERMRRLSPRILLTEPVRYLRTLFPLIIVALIFGTTNPTVLAGAALALVGFFVGGFVTWQTVRYQVGSERLEIRRGLVNRSQRTIPLERIRGVDVTSTLLHRMLGLAVVRVEAAAGGGHAEEGTLDAIETQEAENLRGELLRRREELRSTPSASDTAATAAPETEPDTAAASDSRDSQQPVSSASAPAATLPAQTGRQDIVYFAIAPREYSFGMLSLGYLLTPFVLLATLLGFAGQVVRDARLESNAAARSAAEWVLDSPLATLVWVAAAAGVALLLLMPAFAVVSYTVNNWSFNLRGRDASLVAERGLFTRHSVTLEQRRIRGHEITDNPLERLAATVRLRAIVTGLGDVTTRAMLLPIVRRTTLNRVVEAALVPFQGQLVAHPPAARSRRLFRAVAPVAVVSAVALALDYYWVAGLVALLVTVAVLLGIDRYRSLGHGYDGYTVSVRSGSLSRSQAVIARPAIIGWRWSQSLFQRRVGLATLEVSVGAGSGGYAALDVDFANSVQFVSGVTPDMVRPFLVESPESG